MLMFTLLHVSSLLTRSKFEVTSDPTFVLYYVYYVPSGIRFLLSVSCLIVKQKKAFNHLSTSVLIINIIKNVYNILALGSQQ